MMNSIANSLNEKILTIKSDKKTPIIFFLIGSCPNFSYIQQTPPVILDYIKNPDIMPIVFLIDKVYESKPHTLNFLDLNITDFNQFKPGYWYYPDFIPSLKNSYHHRVAYQFYPQYITNEEIYEFMQLPSVINTMTLIWGFTPLTIKPSFPINRNKMLIPDGDCMANTQYNSVYFPKIVQIDDEYILIDMENNFDEIVNDFINAFNETNIPVKVKSAKLAQLNGFVYYSLKKINEEIPGLRSWEIQLRTRDPEWKINFNKNSTKKEWDHFKMRACYFYNIDKLYTQFMNSDAYYLSEFINSTVYNIGNNLIKINLIEEKYNNPKYNFQLNENIQLEEFISNYHSLVSADIRGLPGIFTNNFEKYKMKCMNIIGYHNM